jgi:hypothetical protein
MRRKINYFLHDQDGKEVGSVILTADNFATVIIEHKGEYYRPLHYNIVAHTCVCLPVEVISVEASSEATRLERKSLATAKAAA